MQAILVVYPVKVAAVAGNLDVAAVYQDAVKIHAMEAIAAKSEELVEPVQA